MINKITTYLFVIIMFTSCGVNIKISSNFENEKSGIIGAERKYFDGLKEKVKENYPEALNKFQEAIKLYPKIDAAYYEMAIIKYAEKDYSTALKNIESAVKIDESNHWYQELYAELLSANSKYDKAANVFKKLRTQNPNNYDYYFNEAYFLLKDNKNKEALKVYNELEEKTGIQPETSNEKYLIYVKEGKFNEAEKELLALTDAYPKNVKYLNKLASFYLLNKNQDKAIIAYDKILKIDPNDTNALMSLADYYKNKDNQEKYKYYAQKAFSNKNINIDTKITILYSYIQESEKDSSKLDEAFEYAILLVKAHPNDAKVWAIYGDLYNLDKQQEKALENYKKSLELRQDIFSVWQQVFFIESDLKKYEELIQSTEEAKELFPNQPLVYFFNGLSYSQQKQYEKSNEAYKKGVKIAVNNPKLKSQLYSNLGENYNDTKEYEKSDENFEKSLAIEPNNQYVLNNYAYYLSLREEKLERAKEMSILSLELSPDNPTYLDTYAWILYKKQEYKEAYKNQEKAIRLSKSPSAALYNHLGDMLYQMNKIDEAIANWKKAQKKGDDSDELMKKITNRKIN